MKLLKQFFGFHPISLFAALLLCVLLVSVMAQNALANGSFRKKPSVVLHASTTLITLPCPPGFRSDSRSCPTTMDFHIALTATTTNSSKQSRYAYTVTGGQVVGEGSKVTWDLDGAPPGIYTASVEVQDNKKHRALSAVMVTIQVCGDCVTSRECPLVIVTCYDQVKAGTVAVCTVKVMFLVDSVTYEWSARDSSGEDLSGRISVRGTSVLIPTNGLGGRIVTATVEIKGLDPSCSPTASGLITVKP